MSRAVMQQALEALVTCCAEEWRTLNNFGMKQVYDEKKVNAAIAALHAALAEPEQKAKPITADEMSAWVKDTWDKCQAEAWQEPSGSFVLWENTLCNPLADPRSMAHSAWHDGYASGVKAEREECAKVCEAEGQRIDASWSSCAAAIRSRA